ncbi:MAG: hypothetical protein JNK60_12785, partial [Acidobacteria bacterium]|nr:hypothetical protein [Acidobacteriota bacterium]
MKFAMRTGLVLGLLLRFSLAAAPPSAATHPRFEVLGDPEGLPQNSVRDLAFDSRGYLWAATQGGAAYYNGRRWTTVRPSGPAALSDLKSLFAGRDGTLYMGSVSAGLAVRDPAGTFSIHTKASGALPDDSVNAFLERPGASGAELWVATGHGLAKLSGGAFTRFPAGENGLPRGAARALAETVESGERMLWVGTENGLAYRSGEAFHTGSESGELPKDPVNTVLPSSSAAGGLYVGTEAGGLFLVRDLRSLPLTGLPGDAILCLSEVELSGRTLLFAGTARGDLYACEGLACTPYARRAIDLPGNAIQKILPSGAGSVVFVATQGSGLLTHRLGGFRALDMRHGLSSNMVYALAEVPGASPGEKDLWIG